MIARLLAALATLALLAGCGAKAPDWPAPAPALWEITAPSGETGWLFGTIHALPDGAEWRTPALDRVARQAGVLVVEVADPGSPRIAEMFRELGETPGQPPLLQRVEPEARPALAALLDRADADEADFAATESWAAALVLAGAARVGDPANGVDRALIDDAQQVLALESIAGQLRLFDALPAQAQSALLAATAREAQADRGEETLRAWLTGDTARLAALDDGTLLADPALREALLAGRNRRWLPVVMQAIKDGRRPLVAVGAAHLPGTDGLIALLEGQGMALRRIQ